MPVRLNGWRFVATLTILTSLACGPAAAADTAAYDGTIARALKLLPRQPEKVILVDADVRPGLSERHVEAFVTHGQRVVYLVRQGVTLQRALNGPGIFDCALATVIWHEMAHIDGADEPTAQREEENLWRQFVLARRVDSAVGMKYLALLKKRRDDPTRP